MPRKIRIDETTVRQTLTELEVASCQSIFNALDEQAGGTLGMPEYRQIEQVVYQLEDIGKVQHVSSEGFIPQYALTAAEELILPPGMEPGGQITGSDRSQPAMAKMGTYEQLRAALTEPPMPEGHLFEFCDRGYWQSLDTRKLLIWIEGVSNHLTQSDSSPGLGTSVVCAEPLGYHFEEDIPRDGFSLDDLVLADSEHFLEDFDDTDFVATDLYEFLCWASQRLVWLSRTIVIGEERSLDEQAGGTWDISEYRQIEQVVYQLEDIGKVQHVSSEGFIPQYALTAAEELILPPGMEPGGQTTGSDRSQPVMAKMGTYEQLRSALTEPPMSEGHLFEFCPRDYWESLNTGQLVKWINAISWYLDDPDREWWGLGSYLHDVDLGNIEINFTGLGHVLDDFKGKNFGVTDLYEFLCWASQRLVWLSRTIVTSEDRS